MKNKWVIFIILIWSSTGCGVKGDPVPPEKSVELGRGSPTFHRATKGIEYPELPPINLENKGSDGFDHNDNDDNDNEND